MRAGALVALALLAGCGGSSSPPAATPTPPAGTPAERPEPTPEEEITALLADRAAALEAGDPAGFAATATGAQRRRDRETARRARALRLADVTLEAGRIRVRGARATARVTLGYALTGIAGTFEGTRPVRLVRRRGAWRVSATPGTRGRAPWEVARFERVRSEHFVVLAPEDVPVGDLVPALEDGYATMRSLLARGRLRRRYLVVVAADAAQAHALTTRIRGVETLAALSDAAVLQSGPALRITRVASLRLLVVWPAFSSLDAAGRSHVVTHELTHAALAGSTSGRTPAWLSEGVALYVSGDRRAAPPEPDLEALSKPDAIARLSGEGQAQAYGASAAAAFAIADRLGHRRLLALYEAFNDPRLRGPAGPRLVDRALRRELDLTLAELEALIS